MVSSPTDSRDRHGRRDRIRRGPDRLSLADAGAWL